MKAWLKPLPMLAALTLGTSPALANDFPTVDRIHFVHECMQDHPGPYFEMSSKCSCALDMIAKEISFEDFRTMHTASLANTIGGERGGYYRGRMWREEARKYRDMQADAKKRCFIDTTSAAGR